MTTSVPPLGESFDRTVPEIVHAYVAAFCRHDLDAYAQTFAEEGVYDYPGASSPARKEQLKEILEPLWTGFPDVVWETAALARVSAAQCVWVWVLEGTHTGDLYGTPATQRRVRWPGCEFIAFRPDAILRVQAYFDFEELRRQLATV